MPQLPRGERGPITRASSRARLRLERRRSPAPPPRERGAGVAVSKSLFGRAARANAVAEPANRFDQISSAAKLRPETLDVHVDCARLNVGSSFPHRLEKMRTSLHPSAALSEQNEKLVFSRREVYRLSRQSNRVSRAVDRNIFDSKNFVSVTVCSGAPENCLYAENKLGRTERLRQV